MRRRGKIITLTCGVLLLVALGRAFFVPLLNLSSRYCFYCGEAGAQARILGFPVWRADVPGNVYRDEISIPAHSHRMIESNGSSYWLLRGMEHRDEFGMVGRGVREALEEAWRDHPEEREEMIRRFLELEPSEDDRMERFIRTYGHKSNETAVPSPDGEPPGARTVE